MMNKYNEPEIVRMYVEDKKSPHTIARKVNLRPSTVFKILEKNGIENVETNRAGKIFKENKPSRKGVPNPKNSYKREPIHIYRNIVGKSPYNISLEFVLQFDLEKLKCLNRLNTTFKICSDTEEYLAFLDKFYNCPIFNRLFDQWVAHGKPTLGKPSIDHIVPISKGGSNHLDNLQIMTWFENKTKKDIPPEEWEAFKVRAKLTSTYFI